MLLKKYLISLHIHTWTAIQSLIIDGNYYMNQVKNEMIAFILFFLYPFFRLLLIGDKKIEIF